MATPVLTAALDGPGPFAPGATITGTWTVVDADNTTETLRLEGKDSQNNAVTVDLTVNRQDSFTMTRIYWPRTNTNLVFNQAARTFTGTVPSA